MREAVGSSMLLYIVVFFVAILILFFVGIVSYSKAYKVKNRVIEIIEKYGTYDDDVESIIKNELDYNNLGYQTGSCPADNVDTLIENNSGYKYCIYIRDCSKYDKNNICIGSRHYKVVTYLHLDLPLVGNYITVPVYGDTKTLGIDYEY